MVDTVT